MSESGDDLGDLEHDNSTNQPKNLSGKQLTALVERIERLEAEKKDLSEDIKEIYVEAKSNGFDAKVLRGIVRMRKQDAAERAEQAALTETYLHAMGLLD